MALRLHWIPGPSGRLAIMGRPRGGEWLSDEIEGLRREGVHAVVSLLTPDETAELELLAESAECAGQGIALHSFPIVDRGLPESKDAFAQFVRELLTELDAGQGVAIHCRAGIGRSSLVAACLLGLKGLDVDEAFRLIGQARGCQVPDTEEQRAWTAAFVKGI